MIIGHEFCGEIVKISSNVNKVKIGDLVAGETHIPCGKCSYVVLANNIYVGI